MVRYAERSDRTKAQQPQTRLLPLPEQLQQHRCLRDLKGICDREKGTVQIRILQRRNIERCHLLTWIPRDPSLRTDYNHRRSLRFCPHYP